MEEQEQFVSKSERKRQATHLQKLGSRLCELNDSDLAQLALPDKLLDAIADYRRFPSREARRRQLQYIGKLMRDIDPEPITAAMADLHQVTAGDNERFHHLEALRDLALSEERAGIEKILAAFPTADRQHLRALLRQHRHEVERSAPPAASRKLFRYLRQLAENSD